MKLLGDFQGTYKEVYSKQKALKIIVNRLEKLLISKF